MSKSLRTLTGALIALISVLVLPVANAGAQDVPPPPPPGSFAAAGYLHPLNAARILDSRSGIGASGAVGSGRELSLQVTGRGGVPNGATAVVLNVTVTRPTASGYLTVYPSGSERPVASNLNFRPGQTVPNLVVAKVGSNGKVNLFNSLGSTHLVADVMGWYDNVFASMPNVAAGASREQSLTPARLLDTRSSSGPVASGREVEVQVTGRGGIPADATAVALNVTAVQSTGAGYVTVYPSGSTKPTASNLNFTRGQVVPNMVIAKIGSNGRIKLFNSSGNTNLVVDATAFFTPVQQALNGGEFNALDPARVLDTRTGIGAAAHKVGPGQDVSLKVAGVGGVMELNVDSVVLNVTVAQPTSNGYITVYPSGSPQPTASNLNFVQGQTVPNLVVAKVGADGRVKLHNSSGSTNLIADVVGFYNSGMAGGPPGVPWNAAGDATDGTDMGSAAAANPSFAEDQEAYWDVHDPSAALAASTPEPLLDRGSETDAATTSSGEAAPASDRTPFPIWSQGYTHPGYDSKIGRLVYWNPTKNLWSSCTATMVARNLAITAAHCVVSESGIAQTNFAFFAGLVGNTANGGIFTNVIDVVYPGWGTQPAYGDANYGHAADYAFIRFGPTASRYPGDNLGWYSLKINPQLGWLSSYGYPAEGEFFKQHCTSPQSQSDAGCYLYQTWGWYGGYNQFPAGWYEIGWGSDMSGGASGGPVFANDNGTMRIVSVNSNGFTEACDRGTLANCTWRRSLLNMWGPYFNQTMLNIYRSIAV